MDSFVFYELEPNMDQPDYEDDRQRYRLLGDSITRGPGAPFGGNYESLLEDRLNAAAHGGRH